MENALLENAFERRFKNITIGDENTLAAFLDDRTSVIVVLGAEAFDERRVVHPWGIDIAHIRSKLTRGRPPHVVVVAEGYKFYRDLLAVPQFYRRHLDRIKLSGLDSVDAVITSNTREDLNRAPFEEIAVRKTFRALVPGGMIPFPTNPQRVASG